LDQTTSPRKAAPSTASTESRYSLADLMDASYGAFGQHPEVVLGAMTHAKLTEATKAEAQAAIDAYLALEV